MPICRISWFRLFLGKILGCKEETVNMLKNFTDESYLEENQMSSPEVDPEKKDYLPISCA